MGTSALRVEYDHSWTEKEVTPCTPRTGRRGQASRPPTSTSRCGVVSAGVEARRGFDARLLALRSSHGVCPVACRRPPRHDRAMKSRVHPTYTTRYRVGYWRASARHAHVVVPPTRTARVSRSARDGSADLGDLYDSSQAVDRTQPAGHLVPTGAGPLRQTSPQRAVRNLRASPRSPAPVAVVLKAKPCGPAKACMHFSKGNGNEAPDWFVRENSACERTVLGGRHGER
ncbi:hypothetical protein LuPra_02557 [Luteitalea pratensis]|uniref:Uncharacterized protein n=1 Tax=Luteitalea pratensis TaxID=1855912 RepID=A0A143PL81_LUTPR|nr:hypothetical protein LuPra_02557 [Luteitalea pratensis]